MFEQLFTASPEVDRGSTIIRRPRKGVIVGAGQVGMACAYSMLIQNALDEMAIVDVNRDKLEGEVMDLEPIGKILEVTRCLVGNAHHY